MTYLTDTRFNACIWDTLLQECPLPHDWSNVKNLSTDPRDPGGRTMCGITQNEYDIWRKASGLAVQDVFKMSQVEGFTIYYGSYWMPHCPQLVAGLDLSFFDASVNEGPHAACKILQASLSIGIDGEWGPQTESAVAAVTNVTAPAVIKRFTSNRQAVYRSLAQFDIYGKDWIARATTIGAQSLEMVGSPPSPPVTTVKPTPAPKPVITPSRLPAPVSWIAAFLAAIGALERGK
jgi:lysozyme family protein